MASLTKIYINSFKDSPDSFRHDLRLDWSNDRHQAVQIEALSPDGIILALQEMAALLREEKQHEHI